MFGGDADHLTMPQFADLTHRRTNMAVNYRGQGLSLQMGSYQEIRSCFFAAVDQRPEKCRIRIYLALSGPKKASLDRLVPMALHQSEPLFTLKASDFFNTETPMAAICPFRLK